MTSTVTVGVTAGVRSVTVELDAMDEVERRLIEAFTVLKRIGGDDRAAFRRSAKSGAPEYVHDFFDKIGWETFQETGETKGATPEDIRRMEEALSWLLPLEPVARQIISARAMRVPWAALLRRLEPPISRNQGWKIYRAGIALIAAKNCQSSEKVGRTKKKP